MKISSKLLIGLPVIVLLTLGFCLRIAEEYKGTGIVSSTGHVVSPSGRVPAFSIITIKGRAFAAQKPEAGETEEGTYTSAQPTDQKVNLFPMAYRLISRGLISGR